MGYLRIAEFRLCLIYNNPSVYLVRDQLDLIPDCSLGYCWSHYLLETNFGLHEDCETARVRKVR